jgi:hypothetical protein
MICISSKSCATYGKNIPVPKHINDSGRDAWIAYHLRAGLVFQTACHSIVLIGFLRH